MDILREEWLPSNIQTQACNRCQEAVTSWHNAKGTKRGTRTMSQQDKGKGKSKGEGKDGDGAKDGGKGKGQG